MVSKKRAVADDQRGESSPVAKKKTGDDSALSTTPHLCRACLVDLSKKKLAAVIAFENGVDVSYFGNWHSACQISTGSRVPVQELKDESNPARVFSAIDDAGKRLVHS